MFISLFLAKAFGLYFIVISVLYAARKETLKAAVNDYFHSPGLILLGGLLTLILGILLILTHSIWEPNWKGAITLLGYLTFLKGIIHILIPSLPAALATKYLKGPVFTYFAGVALLLGLFFCYIGFM